MRIANLFGGLLVSRRASVIWLMTAILALFGYTAASGATLSNVVLRRQLHRRRRQDHRFGPTRRRRGDFLGADMRLRVTIRRCIDVSANSSEAPGEIAKVVLDAPLGDLLAGRRPRDGVPFELGADNCLLGELRAQVELLTDDGKKTLSEAWSQPVQIGIRKHVSLAGVWQVTRIEPFAYESQWRPKDWQQPELKSVSLPGALLHDEWFRGWITVARDIQWNASGDLQPRFLRLSGVADSAR